MCPTYSGDLVAISIIMQWQWKYQYCNYGAEIKIMAQIILTQVTTEEFNQIRGKFEKKLRSGLFAEKRVNCNMKS